MAVPVLPQLSTWLVPKLGYAYMRVPVARPAFSPQPGHERVPVKTVYTQILQVQVRVQMEHVTRS